MGPKRRPLRRALNSLSAEADPLPPIPERPVNPMSDPPATHAIKPSLLRSAAVCALLETLPKAITRCAFPTGEAAEPGSTREFEPPSPESITGRRHGTQASVAMRVRLPATAVALGALLAITAAPALASTIHVFSSSFGNEGSAAGQVSSPQGVAVNDATGDVYVADTSNARVDEFDSSGNFVRAWGWGVADGASSFETCTKTCEAGVSGAGAGQFTTPAFIAVDNSSSASAGDVYVGDTGTNLVQKFDASGHLITAWGTGGQLTGATATDGPFSSTSLAGLAVGTAGSLWVYGDSFGGPMFEFAQDGTFAQNWNSGRGVTASGIGVDSSDELYVATGSPGVTEFTSSGVQIGDIDDSYSNITGIAVDPSTRDLYVDDGGLIHHYDPSCKATVGCTPTDTFGSGNLSSAAGITVNPSSSIIYAADAGDQRIDVFTPPPPLPPTVDGTSAANVTASAADLRAQVNPNYFDTHYHFEVGTTTSYGTSVPVPDADLGSGGADQAATTHIENLAAATTYHYRIVTTNASGATAGPDRIFTTQPTGSTFALPDGRGYEMVSPVDTNDADAVSDSFGWDTRSSTSGDAVTYRSLGNGFAGAQGACFGTQYLSVRGASGWSSRAISPPQASENNPLFVCSIDPYPEDYFTADLSEGLLRHTDPPLTSNAPAGEVNLYAVNLSNPARPSYEVVTPVVPPNSLPYQFNSFDQPIPTVPSANFDEVVFVQPDRLTPGGSANAANVYAWADGNLHLVSVGPDGRPLTDGAVTGAQTPNYQSNDTTNQWGAVSATGARVFFSSPSQPLFSESESFSQIYVRENPTALQSPLDSSGHCTVKSDACTVEVTASQCTSASSNCTIGDGTGGFWAANGDGSEALFTSPDELTNDANTGSADQGMDLYEWHNGTLTDVTPDSEPSDANGADVQGVVGESQDLSYIYFVADGDLAEGATSGQPHLYLYHGGTIRFIATLAPGDPNDCTGDSCLWSSSPQLLRGRVTPDGTYVAFMSSALLTGYDNTDVNTGQPDSEVYLYDASTGRLSCASCNPTGESPTGPSTLGEPGDQNYLPRNLADDGSRLFFESQDRLLPGVSNGNINVYEWEADGSGSCANSVDGGGCLYLLSPGNGVADARFLDADPTGANVFIATSDRLLPEQQQDLVTVYDARVCTSSDPCVAAPAPPHRTTCSDDGCRAVAGAPSSQPLAASVTFSGPGNAKSATTRKVKVVKKTVTGDSFVLEVRVPAGGRIRASGAGVKTVSKTLPGAGTYRLILKLTARARHKLRRNGRLKLRLRVTYTPAAGSPSSVSFSVTDKAR